MTVKDLYLKIVISGYALLKKMSQGYKTYRNVIKLKL